MVTSCLAPVTNEKRMPSCSVIIWLLVPKVVGPPAWLVLIVSPVFILAPLDWSAGSLPVAMMVGSVIRKTPPTVDNCRVRLREHQEEVLTGGRIGQTEFQVLTGSDENLIQQIERIIGVRSIWVLERLVLHGPDLAARDRRSGFFNIGSEHDRAGCAPGSAQKDVVVRIRIEKDAGAIEGIQSAVHAIERCASAVDEADIGNASSGSAVRVNALLPVLPTAPV